MTLQHKFVELIPDDLPAGWLFISLKYKTAVHKCICGCGNEVVTPISPTDWQLTFDGQSISLNPSIGNWSFDCRSHYWIVKNSVIMSGRWTDKEIHSGRERDRRRKKTYFRNRNAKRTLGRRSRKK